MLSYRHVFHAGNHADVLKHLILEAILSYFAEKSSDFVYFDTHAGTGLYDLSSRQALQNREYNSGILKLLNEPNLSPFLANFVAKIRENCPENHYFGSPFWAGFYGMKMRLFERHSKDFVLLQENMKRFRLGRNLKISAEDGFSGLIAQLPPTPRRAVVLIDPSYEQKSEYKQVLETLKEAQKRFASGCYVIWYPCLQKLETQELIRKLRSQYQENFYWAELQVKSPSADGFGMHGSGIFVINPPYLLPNIINPILPELVNLLGQDKNAKSAFNQNIQ